MFEGLKIYFDSLLNSKEIRNKVFFTILALIIFRLLASVPVVGIPAEALRELFSQNSFFDIVSTVSGGVLETASLVAVGLSPYINASIIFQLLSSVIPKLKELRKEGSQGQKIINMYTRFLALPLAIAQSFVIYSTLRGFGLIEELTPLELAAMSATLTGGAMIMMWLGELVTEKGISNGISFLIFAGIVSMLPSSILQNFEYMDTLEKVIVIGIFLGIFAVVIIVNEAERRIKTLYSRRSRNGMAMENYLPIKLAQFGVLPVIFAVSLLSFPQLIAQFLVARDISENVTNFANRMLELLANPYIENVGIFAFVIAFSFFYITVVFNTDDLAENLQKQGAFIPGIRPGKSTSKYLKKISFRLTAVGALFLGFLAVLPNLLVYSGIVQTALVSGTGLLIAVSVALEMKRKYESMMVVRSYDKYL
jgi:preprotein translocase subunit SecY